MVPSGLSLRRGLRNAALGGNLRVRSAEKASMIGTMHEEDQAPRAPGEDDDAAAHVIVPWDRLSEAALEGVITEFVTREGTEYGEHEVPLDRKIAEVRAQILRGDVVILFHAKSETVNLARAKDVPGL